MELDYTRKMMPIFIFRKWSMSLGSYLWNCYPGCAILCISYFSRVPNETLGYY